MLKPLAAIRTDSSPGIENAVIRDAAEATSSRATSSDCDGTLSRTRRPAASAHSVSCRSPPGFFIASA